MLSPCFLALTPKSILHCLLLLLILCSYTILLGQKSLLLSLVLVNLSPLPYFISFFFKFFIFTRQGKKRSYSSLLFAAVCIVMFSLSDYHPMFLSVKDEHWDLVKVQTSQIVFVVSQSHIHANTIPLSKYGKFFSMSPS